MIIAVVGAGGKTTRIHKLAKEYQQQGKRVLITTTTHMMQEASCILGEKEDEILKCLCETGICMAGNIAKEGKLCGFSEDFFEKIYKQADVILVEADGSKGYPLKVPRSYEPVIPSHCDRIDVVMGISAIGRPLKDVSHRLGDVMRFTGLSSNHVITECDMEKVIRYAYVKPLRLKYPQCEVQVHLGQVNTLQEKKLAEKIRKASLMDE